MFRTWRANQHGSVAAMNGFIFFALAVAAGGAVDYSSAVNNRSALQQATDAAVLAAAALPDVSDQERQDRAKAMFLGSKFCEKHTCKTPAASMDESAIKLDTSADVKTSLLQIMGMSSIELQVVSSAVPIATTPVDVAMILDFSGSMNSSNKYQDMASAATLFLNSAEAQPGNYLSVGLVPFSKYVLTPMHGRYLYDVSASNNLMGQSVVGCVLNREHPHSTTVAEPSVASVGSLWPVFSFTPAGANAYSDTYTGPPPPSYTTGSYSYGAPGGAGGTGGTGGAGGAGGTGGTMDYTLTYYDNDPGVAPTSITANYFVDGSGADGMEFDGHGKFNFSVSSPSGHPIRIVNQGPVPTNDPYANYGGYGGSNGWTPGDDSSLPSTYDQALLAENLSSSCGQYATNALVARPLSQDFTTLKTAVSAMRPIGLTNIALGIDLGWHMLTPEEPFTEASTEEGAEKIAILLTDGVQTVKAHGAGGNVSMNSANANIAESCAAMKADDVEIFTIAFGINDAYTRDLLKACATSDPHYFEPSTGGDLDAVFQGIFNKIISGEVRLTG